MHDSAPPYQNNNVRSINFKCILNRSILTKIPLATFFLFLSAISLVSPQISQLGHGLFTTLPALGFAGISILHSSPYAFRIAIRRFKTTYFFGGLYLLQAGMRFALLDGSITFWQNYFVGPLLTLVILLLVAAFSEFGSKALEQLRRWIFFGWCFSLALGLPALVNNAGVSRLTMGSENASANALIWAPQGVGQFTVYTSFSICAGPLLLVVLRLRGIMSWLAFILLVLGSMSVIYSTFTMAVVILLISLICGFIFWIINSRGANRLQPIIITGCLFLFVTVIGSQIFTTPQINFVTTKLQNLYEGVTSEGLSKGDETGRGEWFTEELNTFNQEPFLGFIPGVTGISGHGHSSLSDSLVLFGLFGASFWLITVWSLLRKSLKEMANKLDKGIIIVAWITLCLSGILNPTWQSAEIVGVLIIFTIPFRKQFAK